MNLQECLDHLATGELANTNLVEDDQIKDTKVNFIISLINEALIRLYSRFVLKEDYALLELNELRTVYVLTKDHTYGFKEDIPVSSKTCLENYDKYIFQTENHPFTENIIRILRVVTSGGITLPLNDATEPTSVFTPSFNSVQFPIIYCDGEVAVTYQAKHPELSLETLDKELELPDTFLGAMYSYVAYLAYASMQSEGATAAAQKYLGNYQALLDELVTFDLSNNSSVQTNIKFSKNGWC